jgi:ABC-2 type transport system permease protein
MSATQTIYTLWLREMKWFVRAKSRLISSLIQPFLWLAIMGVGMGAAFKISGYIQFIVPGVIGMTLIFSSMMSGVSVLWDKQFGFMKEILVAPVSRTHVMLGKALGGMTVSMLQGILLLLAAGLIVGVWPPSVIAFIQVLAFMALISLGFVGAGLAFASKIEDPVAFPVVINFLILPLFFLSGAFFPISASPDWMKTIGYFNPLMYGVDGLRGAISGTSNNPILTANFSALTDFGILFVFCAAMVLLGGYLFRKISA